MAKKYLKGFKNAMDAYYNDIANYAKGRMYFDTVDRRVIYVPAGERVETSIFWVDLDSEENRAWVAKIGHKRTFEGKSMNDEDKYRLLIDRYDIEKAIREGKQRFGVL